MNMDMLTLELTLTLAYFFFGVLLASLWCMRRSEAALFWWASYNLACSAGHLLLSIGEPRLRGTMDGLVAGLLGLGYLCIWVGCRRFAGQSVDWRLLWLLPLTAAALVTPYGPAGGSLAAKSGMHSLMIMLMCAICLVHEWRAQKGEYLMMRNLALACFAVTFVVMLGRLADTLLNPPQAQDYLAHNIGHALINLISLSLVMFLGISVLLMSSERQQRKLDNLARTDALTGVLNRGGFARLSRRHFDRCRRDGRPASVLLMDLDHFKTINDSHGHDAGDRMLCAFAEMAGEVIRPGDLLGRHGGEEFCALLPGSTVVEAYTVAERVRSRFEQLRIEPGLGTTVSIGVAQIDFDAGNPLDAALQKADQALYEAKRLSRNRVSVAPIQPLAGMLPVTA